MVRFVENDDSLLDNGPVESIMNSDDPFVSGVSGGEFADTGF